MALKEQRYRNPEVYKQSGNINHCGDGRARSNSRVASETFYQKWKTGTYKGSRYNLQAKGKGYTERQIEQTVLFRDISFP